MDRGAQVELKWERVKALVQGRASSCFSAMTSTTLSIAYAVIAVLILVIFGLIFLNARERLRRHAR